MKKNNPSPVALSRAKNLVAFQAALQEAVRLAGVCKAESDNGWMTSELDCLETELMEAQIPLHEEFDAAAHLLWKNRKA